MSITIGYDTIWANVSHLPAGAQWAGYSTGTGDVPWPRAWLDAHPGVLRYCQDPGATDTTADVLDVETGAATVADCPGWVRAASVHWATGTRPGQRRPAIYVNGSNITPVANALTAAKLTARLVVANWNLDQAEATVAVLAAIALLSSGAADPFPVVGLQFSDPGPYDIDVYSSAWLADVSRKPLPAPPAVITDGVLQSAAMGWTGHRMRSADHGETWTEVNE